ncbi:MAG TPA: hypothetical protein VK395_14195 [Gemmataceae bacterium]|nr:hypothetical protein [Gemmataceae bacterium]
MKTHILLGFFAIPLLVMLQAVGSGAVWAQPTSVADCKDRFLSEAPKGWAKYYAKATQLKGQIRTRAVNLGSSGRVIYENAIEIKQAPGCAILLDQTILQDGKADTHGRLSAINPKYRFQLRRATTYDPWAVALISEDLTPERRTNAPDISEQASVHSWIACPIAMYGAEEDWPSLLSSAPIQLKHVFLTEKGRRDLVQVDFEIAWGASEQRFRTIKGGKASFDPEHCWVMRDCDVRVEWWRGPNKAPSIRDISASYDYSDGGEDFPVLKRRVEREQSSSGAVLETQDDFSLVSETVPESDFMLTAFGFPEPAGLLRGRTPWYLWAAIGGVTFIALGLVFRRWARRNSPS